MTPLSNALDPDLCYIAHAKIHLLLNNIIFPEFLMISAHFPPSFPTKIDMFFLESVVCKSHEA